MVRAKWICSVFEPNKQPTKKLLQLIRVFEGHGGLQRRRRLLVHLLVLQQPLDQLPQRQLFLAANQLVLPLEHDKAFEIGVQMRLGTHLDKRLGVTREREARYVKVVMIHMSIHAKQLLKDRRHRGNEVLGEHPVLTLIVRRSLEQIGNVLEKRVDVLIGTHLPNIPCPKRTLTGLLPRLSVQRYV